ncbi:iron complex transport system substrate-binding protein [Saccharopolyspora antimicrobica]|uniref:Iron complex transport system substrate-binding protein n=1 Tax=Saccharopolyspora antimicrobica TaxID=455193 RepID=A0A1I4U1K2_9PSEU|nr:siderophore ABC transporter substrate-binding protein [Saccharopolyspora antimicrobica]RKT88640.1 iron complex transport system substrate-binding protein [Saccharopolyspora antimicrobica]SFM82902.1 iron complex transport system substrate-binding protein [Saccharopolyspora antimicrobica]
MLTSMFRRGWLAVIAVAALFVLSGCGGSAGGGGAGARITVEHAQGSTQVPAEPRNVVVFDIGVLVTLDELGVPVAGVPKVASLPESLAKYGTDEYPKVGSLKEPDFEKVNELAPDLIVVAGRSASQYAELSKIAPTIDLTVDNADFLASAKQRTEVLGTIFGKQAEVEQRFAALDDSVRKVREQAAAKQASGLVVLTTGGKISAYGPGSRFGIVHDSLGVAPAREGLSTETHGDAISPEFIAEVDPDVLYVVDRDAAIGEEGKAAAQVLDNALVQRTKAARDGKIVYLDPFTWYIAPTGLSSVEQMVRAVGDSLS